MNPFSEKVLARYRVPRSPLPHNGAPAIRADVCYAIRANKMLDAVWANPVLARQTMPPSQVNSDPVYILRTPWTRAVIADEDDHWFAFIFGSAVVNIMLVIARSVL